MNITKIYVDIVKPIERRYIRIFFELSEDGRGIYIDMPVPTEIECARSVGRLAPILAADLDAAFTTFFEIVRDIDNAVEFNLIPAKAAEKIKPLLQSEK